jgi:beta-lactam-binding protein with PASTA domain
VFKFLKNKPLWVHLLTVIIATALLVLLFFGSLDFITQHGDYEKVPQVTGMNIDQARKVLEAKGFDVAIQDSVYIDSAARLSVIKQSPVPDATVKANRTIYLTVNRMNPPLVEMPNLVGFSFRNAEMYLNSLGLKMGDTLFRPDIAKNAVLQQLYNGIDIKPGSKIFMGSTISFVLGDGIGSAEINVPDLIGMTVSEATKYLSDNSLGLGVIIPLDNITDTANSFVVKTNPERFSEPVPGQKTMNKIRSGQSIDLYISTNAPAKDTTIIQ